ncbi:MULTISPECIES: adenylate/guanylate cyclase domain-containing protein [Bradyrhizobium]|uniref:TolB amino-terminal domain-containing protein n=2 Tax=Bradyrhizobium TaxID=374 RepID=A0ABY0Q5S0_9BRAD|nr:MULTISPECIES: adenylate/guanylate cyclase domain-containing protein [Bradyrhizobium]SDJ53739.1 TolB amino-terminal domain-containing protein [Bradyrhizobium ottawaense]SEC46136.1 TolB amino-terminal domain-containing protein [Bradyrhizobium lablabi]SHK68113.1 TolB amino-terminal domain-containing protein [Bradyrhizobium lablabi]
MASERVERRLTAILAADVAGYSRLTGLDEEGTHVQLQDHLRTLIDPKITEHRGRVVKNTGDGMLAEFSSVVDAMRCALDVQRGMVERNVNVPQGKRIEFRVGINVGDIIIDRSDIFGDGVNVAARLEGLAEPGGICVSDDAYRQLRDKIDIVFDDAGEQKLKNIERPVRVFRVKDRVAAAEQRPTLVLPDKPSIAVLPFQNLSADPEQEYFADGVVEDITMALSLFRWLFVIARNSSFTYKGRAVDVKQIGRELGVRYVLEGSVRKAGNRIRIAGQLIDAETGAHLWADRFDGALEDMFDLQDHVTSSVVGAIAPKLQSEDIKRATRKPTENLDAYDYYLRGLAKARYWNRDANSEALQLFCKAIELDPHLACAYGMAAWCYMQRKARGWMIEDVQESAEATRLARKAVHLGGDDPVALCMGGYSLAFVAHEFNDAVAFMDRGLTVNPNLAQAWNLSAWLRVWRGEPDVALDHVAHAMRLSPLDPSIFSMHGAMAYAHFLAGRYDMASSCAEKATRDNPTFVLAMCISAASNALAGRLEPAQKAMVRVLERSPDLRASNLINSTPFRRAEDLATFAKGLRNAGLPD